MKPTLSLQRVALLGVALATAGVSAAFAQTTTTTPAAPAPTCSAGMHHHHGSILTEDEKAQLKKDHDAVLASDPSLKTEEDNLKQQHETLKSEGTSATDSDRAALFTQFRDFHQKMRDAMVKLDPSVEPILNKLEAARKSWHHSDDSNT
jgi:Spy/CpxP family protein refolding chaperone